MLAMTTRLAGRLTPAARVGVAVSNLITPFLNELSTISLLDGASPA